MSPARNVAGFRADRSLLDLHLESRQTVEKIKLILTAEGVAIRPRVGPKGRDNTAHKFRNPNCKQCG